MSDITREGARLIADWLKAKEATQFARQRLNSAECSEMNAHNALAKWLMPSDAKVGEKIAVWEGDSLFQVEVGEHDHKVTVRTRGKHFHDLRVAS